MKQIIFSLFVIGAIFAMPTDAQAIGNQCTVNGSGQVDITGDEANSGIQTCTTDAVGMKYTFNAFGMCDGFPDLTTGLSNCFNVISEDTEVDMSNGSGAPSISGFMPESGDYDYFFAITEPTFSVTGEVEFSEAYVSSNAASDNIGTGSFCTPKTASFSTNSILNLSLSSLTQFISNLSGLADLMPFSCASTSVGSGNEGTASFTINNVNMTGTPGFSSAMNIESYTWTNGTDADNEVNIILLDAQNAQATSAANVDKVLFIKNRNGEGGNPSPFTVDGSHTEMDVTFSVTDALQIFYLCDSALTSTLSSDCAILAPMLGEAAFTPAITTAP